MILLLVKKFLGHRSARSASSDPTAPEETVQRIQAGEENLLNAFITDYQPFVAKVASRYCKKYIDPSRDDEYSIALQAFHEALYQFSSDGGRSFLGFAETVIRRRLIDYFRREHRHASQVPLSSFDVEDEEDNVMNPVEARQAQEQYELDRASEERRLEIAEFSRQLAEYGIAFAELVEASPKHADSRDALLEIGRILASDDDMMAMLLGKKMLPIKDLLDRVEVSRKTLERNRKYLIAVTLIHYGVYPHLQEYLHIAPDTAERSGRNG